MQTRKLIALLAWTLPLAAAPAWTVRAHSTVQAAVVRLGDVCPGAALAATRAVLSAAPQPGIRLVWSDVQFAARLRAAGLTPSDFAIPARVEVERQAQAIPPAAVVAAIGAYLHRPLTAAEVRFTAPLTTAAEPAVEVVGARRDAAHGRLEVICRARHDAALLPFAVSVAPAPGDLARLAQQKLARATAAPTAAPGAPPARPILVRPGQAATLAIRHPGFAITTTVEPLQAGRAGDRIPVRNPGNHALLRVYVTGPNLVSDEAPHVP